VTADSGRVRLDLDAGVAVAFHTGTRVASAGAGPLDKSGRAWTN
jgi:hypothetical protein